MSNRLPDLTKVPSPPPPPAPPLPSQRQQGFVANAFARVAQPFGYGSRPQNATQPQAEEPRPSRLGPEKNPRCASEYSLIQLFTGKSTAAQKTQEPLGIQRNSTDKAGSPISSRTTTHKTGIPINALDISPDRTQAILAGHNILKTIQISDAGCAEVSNLRAKIIGFAAAHESSGNASPPKRNAHLVANDVKWSHGQYGSTIATAAATGQIIIYDINRAGIEIARLHEHSRQVNKLGFNPHSGHLLLSGDQDGIVRLWDLRALTSEKNVASCHSIRKFTGNSNSIRDLKWSPTNGVEFAFCTDNGTIQRWDFRYDKNPQLRINAHIKQCYSIDWHPDGKYLVSGGQDKNIKIWDFSSSDRKQKSIWEIRAPQEVRNVRWRPACWVSTKQGPAKWQCSQIAASYDQQDPRIDIWDFRRPSFPFLSLHQYDTPASGLLWHSENLLWSVGSAGMFTQTDTKFVPRTVDRRSPNTLAIAPSGQILHFSQKRERRRAPFGEALDGGPDQQQRTDVVDDRSSGSHSSGRGIYHGQNFLNPALLSRHRKQPITTKSSRSTINSSTITGAQDSVEGLDSTMRQQTLYPLEQIAAVGHIEGDHNAYTFLRLTELKVPDVPKSPQAECKLHEVLPEALIANAELAESINQHRMSQSLQVLAGALFNDLKNRADINRHQRVTALLQDAGETNTQRPDDGPDERAPAEPIDTISNDVNYILEDYQLPLPMIEEAVTPFSISHLVGTLVDYHFHQLKDIQLPAWLFLYICPWIHYKSSVSPEIVLMLYYQQLRKLDLHMQASELRNAAYERFGHITAIRSLGSTEPKYFCYKCMKYPAGTNPFDFCNRCNTAQMTCPICEDEGTSATALQKWCQGCGHWGHDACIREFWEPGSDCEGICAVVGCNHVCKPKIALSVVGDESVGDERTVHFAMNTQQ